MKILYALQATGNGHISRANELIPLLQSMAEVDVLLSGTQSDISLDFPVKYRKKGLSILLNKKGSVHYLATLKQLKAYAFLQELHQIPVEEYDFVINDFEPLSAWACRFKKVPCIALSHQYALLNNFAPKPPKMAPLAWMLLNYYAPATAGLGLHFQAYCPATHTPVIRSQIRNAYNRNLGHYTVYLPAYSDKKIIRILSMVKQVQWQIFSRHARQSYSVNNCWVRPICNHQFISSISTCEGILCAAGFETPAEALYLQKKLMVIPIKGQYEQQCNAYALKKMGVPVLKNLKTKRIKSIRLWVTNSHRIGADYANNCDQMIAQLFEIYGLINGPAALAKPLPFDGS